jgi:hypothetical protein
MFQTVPKPRREAALAAQASACATDHGDFTGCGKSGFSCHPERSEGSAFSQLLGKKQIPRANPALGMTVLEFFRSLFSLLKRIGVSG